MHLSLVKDTMFVLSTRGVPSRDLFVSYSYSSPFLSLQHIALSVHTQYIVLHRDDAFNINSVDETFGRYVMFK